MKFELQYQNMIGRTVIATVAVSLKSYFASLHSFQNRVAELQNALKENNLNIDDFLHGKSGNNESLSGATMRAETADMASKLG